MISGRFAAWVAVLTAIAGAFAHGATSGVNVQTHTAVANAVYSKTESARGADPGSWLGGVDYHFLDDALVELNPARDRRTTTWVRGLQTLDITAAYQQSRFWAFGATMPLSRVSRGDGLPGEGGSTLGDLRLFSRWSWREDPRGWSLAWVPELRLPTGRSRLFVSDGEPGAGVTFALERAIGRFRLAANLAYRYAPGARFREIDYRHRVPLALALYAPINARWSASAEATQTRILPLNGVQNPGEIYAGLRYFAAPGLSLSGGASLGAMNGQASQDYRVLLGLRYQTPGRAPSESAPGSDSWLVRQSAPVREAPTPLLVDAEIPFAHASATIPAWARSRVEALAKTIRESSGSFSEVAVEGHCNELGSESYNLALGARRASAVVEALRREGVPAELLRPVSYGESRPLPRIPGTSREEALARDRRVALRAAPL